MRPAVVSVSFCLRGAAQHSLSAFPVSPLQVSSVGRTRQDFKTDIGDGRRSARWGYKYCYPCRACSSLALEILLPLCMQSPIPVSLPCTHASCVRAWRILLCSEPYCQLFIRRERTRPKTHKIDTDVAHFTDAHIGRGESAAPAKAHLVLSESMTVSTLIPPRRSPTTTSIPKRRSKAPLLALLSPWLLQLFV